MESAKHTINEAVQAIQELDLGENICSIIATFKKECKNDISKIMSMATNISPAVYSLQHPQPTAASVERSFPCCEKYEPRMLTLRSKC